MKAISQSQFDQLAIFVAVASELGHEPFFSEDNHETLVTYGDGSFKAYFGHPAFLKSAILPFRRLWLTSESCAFPHIRDFVFEMHPDQYRITQYKKFVGDHYARLLDQLAFANQTLTVRDLVDIWIYTHAVHAGPGRRPNKKDRQLQEFDHWERLLGREHFEHQFRFQLRLVGHSYVDFNEQFAKPMFLKFQEDDGMKPGFQAQSAITYNPYPDPSLKITFEDPFWHLDKETVNETFDRLLARQSYTGVKAFMVAFFSTRAAAMAAVQSCVTLEDLFDAVKAVFLEEGEETNARGMHFGGGGCNPGAVGFDAWEGPAIRIDKDNREKLKNSYGHFRAEFLEHRRLQRGRCHWSYVSRWD